MKSTASAVEEKPDDNAELNALRNGGFPGKGKEQGKLIPGNTVGVKGNPLSGNFWWRGESCRKRLDTKEGSCNWRDGKSSGKSGDSKGGSRRNGTQGQCSGLLIRQATIGSGIAMRCLHPPCSSWKRVNCRFTPGLAVNKSRPSTSIQ